MTRRAACVLAVARFTARPLTRPPTARHMQRAHAGGSHLGQGDSDTPEARGFSLSIDALADDMADVCEAAGGGAPVHLVGHSMGGYCALRVASRRPELVASLTLVGSRAQAEHPFKLVEIGATRRVAARCRAPLSPEVRPAATCDLPRAAAVH